MTFIELLQELKIDYRTSGQHHHCTEGFVQIDCPQCSPNSKTFKLGYSINGRFMNCWHCGHVGVLTALCDLTNKNLPFMREACRGLRYEKVVHALSQAKYDPIESIVEFSNAHYNYLNSRKLNVSNIKKIWRVRCTLSCLEFPWRIFIPIFYCSQPVSWTTRAIHPDNQPRYIAAPKEREAIPAKSLLYGEDYARSSIVVVEGPIDVWAIGPGAVATMGTAYTRDQVLKMSKYPKRAICFDNEPLAQARASKLCDLLNCFPGETYKVCLDTGKDAAAASKKEIAKLRESFL